MIAVRFFSTQANYVSGDFVVQAGGIWVAKASITAGAFNPAQWSELAYLTDIPALYVLPVASTSVLGGVKIDGTTITISSGVISSAGLVTVSSVAPSPVQNGALWYDLVGGQLYAWVNDGSSSQWVIAVNQNLAGGVWLPLTGGMLSGAISGPSATFDNLSAPQAIGDNRIVNGDMRIDQRYGGVAGQAAINTYTVDRWRYAATQPGKSIWGRGSSGATLPAFPYCLTFQSTSAYAVVAGDAFAFMQTIEADMVSDFAWGSASAQPVTLSFWVASNLTGTFSASIQNVAGTRSYPFAFSVPNTAWNRYTITIPGDTAAAWVTSGNAGSIVLTFDLGTGVTYRGPANAWAPTNYVGVNGAVSVVATNSATFNLTGVKLETGSVATPYNRQSLAKSMADCQRYYQALGGHVLSAGYATAGTAVYTPLLLPVQMRATPTVAYSGVSYSNASGMSLAGATPTQVTTVITGAATGETYGIGTIAASAEL